MPTAEVTEEIAEQMAQTQAAGSAGYPASLLPVPSSEGVPDQDFQ